MDPLEKDAITILRPVAAYGLGLMFPAIPAGVWLAIFAALKNGDLNAAAFDAFLAEHGLKTYAALNDFPDPPPQTQTPNNLGVNQPPT
jgi:ABC-type amino acid transport substrate-binding protein